MARPSGERVNHAVGGLQELMRSHKIGVSTKTRIVTREFRPLGIPTRVLYEKEERWLSVSVPSDSEKLTVTDSRLLRRIREKDLKTVPEVMQEAVRKYLRDAGISVRSTSIEKVEGPKGGHEVRFFLNGFNPAEITNKIEAMRQQKATP
ncbi:MAG: hypothetical protein V1787_00090 [Candidatus Micrarchaeota archaeon]